MAMESLRQLAKECVLAKDIHEKIALSSNCYKKLRDDLLGIYPGEFLEIENIVPGRPDKPGLVSPTQVPRRGFGTIEGQVTLLHAIAHIEFNAINLAWDAVCRFGEMPNEYYKDWSKVAYEETQHFNMLLDHLNYYGYKYGDFAAHDGLWQMAERTKQDVLVRMALVPRVLEARGLDVTPGMIKKFNNIGDDKTVKILNKIYEEEIGHVERGSYWFNYTCHQRQIDPQETFRNLIEQYYSDGLRGPFNFRARENAGFSSFELSWLKKTRC